MKHDSDILKRIKSYFMRRKSADEAYDFEREMERDAFLYEAVEGFEDMHVSDLQQAMDELDDRLDKKALRGFSFAWWQAAAVVGVILVGAGVFAILNNIGNMKQGAEETVAGEAGTPPEKKAPEPAAETAGKQQYEPRVTTPWFDALEGIGDSLNAIAASQPEEPTGTIAAVETPPQPTPEERAKAAEAREKKAAEVAAAREAAVATGTTKDPVDTAVADEEEIAAAEEPTAKKQMDALVQSEQENSATVPVQEAKARQAASASEKAETNKPAGGMTTVPEGIPSDFCKFLFRY